MARNKLGIVTLLGLWLAACARVDDSKTAPGSAEPPAEAGASGGGRTGAGGEPTINLVIQSVAGQPAFYPAPFDARSCPTPPSSDFGGSVRCVTRAELADSNLPDVTLDGGVSALGPTDDWRCPQLNELTFSGPCGGEKCCELGVCGPLAQRTSEANDAGAAGDRDAGSSEQSCCYYIQEWCGV